MSHKPEEPAAGAPREDFVSRWSRRKQEARETPPQPPAAQQADPKEPAPELTPIDQLTIESDYQAFFHPKVGEDVRRSALKKLFSDPHFNVMDGLDVYIDDYTKNEPIPPEMLAGLRQAQNILAWAKEDEEQRARDAQARAKLEVDAPPRAIESPVDTPAIMSEASTDAPAPPDDAVATPAVAPKAQ